MSKAAKQPETSRTTATVPGPAMNTSALYALGGGLLAGLLIGFLVGRQTASGSSPVPAVTAAAPAPMTPAAPLPAAMPNPQSAQQITQIELLVQREPKNRDAWADLGNLYFDTHQHEKAIDAYGKALALKPDDPNVLTDQGVMYKDIGQFEKAVANFKKANQLDPKHGQSLFNLGVVYANDLNKPEEAAKAWKKLIETLPGSPQAAQAQQALAQLKARK
jgi:tetratricopeptide (TPR) repeat protein